MSKNTVFSDASALKEHLNNIKPDVEDIVDEVSGFIRSLNERRGFGLSEAAVKTHAEQWTQALVSKKQQRLVLPRSWEDAQAQVPGLMKWADAKAANPKLTIIDHLRDEQHGMGKWALHKPGLPRALYHILDKQGYKAVYNWLSDNELPPDIYYPSKKAITDHLVAQADNPSELPVHVYYALRSRKQRGGSSR